MSCKLAHGRLAHAGASCGVSANSGWAVRDLTGSFHWPEMPWTQTTASPFLRTRITLPT